MGNRLGRWTTRVVLTVLSGALALSGLPAQAATPVTPGSFTGFAFDTCDTPDSATMDLWRTSSPFWGVGVYLGGEATTCDRSNLTSAWVSRQAKRGWRILPIWVGPQAVCSTIPYAADIDPDPASSYAAAAAQGRRNANAAVAAAKRLGIPPRSTLWYDIEDYGLSDDHCRKSALTFLSAWTKRLHALGFTSGVYSSVGAAVHSLDYADEVSPGSYAMPDQIWYAWDNGRADTFIDKRWVRGSSWAPRARVHQYELDTPATYGGVTMEIDFNFIDVGGGSVAPKPLATCGVRVDFRDYKGIRRGSSGPQVKAAQCLLKKKRMYGGRIHGRYDAGTVRAVKAFQRARSLRVTGTMTAPTWTVLLAEGKSVLLKRGSVGDPVRRVQRGLTAALDSKVAVTGVVNAGTTRAIMRYQRTTGLSPTGVVDPATWAKLEAGRR
jgi:hypothetical protein